MDIIKFLQINPSLFPCHPQPSIVEHALNNPCFLPALHDPRLVEKMNERFILFLLETDPALKRNKWQILLPWISEFFKRQKIWNVDEAQKLN